MLSTLEEAYTNARYSPEFEVSQEVALILFERVKQIHVMICDVFEEHMKLYEIEEEVL